jgi:3-dehydrotetronate 4-kinase
MEWTTSQRWVQLAAPSLEEEPTVIRLGAIADDFTGATDLATSLRERGLRVVVVLDPSAVPSADEAEARGLDAVVVALKTRTAPVPAAVGASLDALRALAPLDPGQYYVKYCSTFDSTPAGNIGPVLDAVLDELGETRTIVAPAFPDNGRTVVGGLLRVGDQLLSDSPMRHHPLTPMTESRVAAILAPQTARSIGEVDLASVRSGPDALRTALDALAQDVAYVVVDTETVDDLGAVQAAVADWRVVSGSAGLAYGMDGPHDPASEPFPVPAGRRLVICGSASAKTRDQIASARDAGAAMLQLDVDRIASAPDEVVASTLDWLETLPADAVPVVYSVGDLADIRDNSDGGGPADVIERVNARIVREAVTALDVRQVIVAGGETSGAVVTGLGCASLLIGPQIAPGVCWAASTTSEGIDVVLALKSGNFGADDMFTTAWEALA